MDIRINPIQLSGTVAAISSKSDLHRVLVCAALSDRATAVDFSGLSADIKATINCLNALGACVELTASGCVIYPIKSAAAQPVHLNCGESGSTLRYLVPVAAALGMDAQFSGEGRLPERPIEALIDALERRGYAFTARKLPFHMHGLLTPGRFVIPGNISSAFITGLLFALPLLEGDSELVLSTPLQSAPYVDMTLSTMQKFGVQVEKRPDGYFVPGNQRYVSPRHIIADGDWSNSAFWLCAGALSKPVTVTGLSCDSPQGDKAILGILKDMGAEIEADGSRVTVRPGELHGIELDVSNIPDLAPAVAVVATKAAGTTRIVNASRLRAKESDRLTAIASTLNALGAKVEELPDGFVIHGGKALTGGRADGFNDHRIVMAAAIASVICEQETIIAGAHAVNKSYGTFFEDFIKLGGSINVIDDRN